MLEDISTLYRSTRSLRPIMYNESRTLLTYLASSQLPTYLPIPIYSTVGMYLEDPNEKISVIRSDFFFVVVVVCCSSL